MSKTNFTKSKEVNNLTAICNCASNGIDWAKNEANESSKTDREFFKCQQTIATDINLTAEEKKYQTYENHKTYRLKEEHKTHRFKIGAILFTIGSVLISSILFIPKMIFYSKN
ncbi:MAG: hypothetical protein IKJ19_03340 [Clostridia bacterium]|nr:hypothetical protein [Clostridia bacterium]